MWARRPGAYTLRSLVGTNKRHADTVARRSTVAMYARIVAEGTPESLTDAELDLAHEPLVRSPVDRPVIAWVRYGRQAVRVRAIARSWTVRAVAIKWRTPAGAEHRAWVWSDAIVQWLPVEDARPRVAVLGDEQDDALN